MRNKLITLFIAIITVSACSGAFAAKCRNVYYATADTTQLTASQYSYLSVPSCATQSDQAGKCVFFEKEVYTNTWQKFKICRCSQCTPNNPSTGPGVQVSNALVSELAGCDSFDTPTQSGFVSTMNGYTVEPFCCKQCSVTCTADTDFANDGTSGYQKKVSAKHCDCQTGASCHNDTTLWRCADGFWGMRGTGSSTKGTCTKCPDFHGITIHSSYTTSGTTNVYITSCYISAGTYTDTTGTFTVASQCKYEN